MNKSEQLFKLGQSIWYDNIQRNLLTSGKMAEWIKEGKIYGVTSNPTIFNNAISKSDDYDQAIQTMAWSGWDSIHIFDQLAKEDISAAADLFLPVYNNTEGKDGYVSIEVNPLLARNTEETISEARRLWREIDRPNLMIKIPATREGLPAITLAISEGINVNVTLIFSLQRYQEVMEAFVAGLEARAEQGLPVNKVASVASFFVSRMDSKVDQLLEQKATQGNDPQKYRALQGKAAIANTRMAYAQYQKQESSDRFKALKMKGAKFQRPLWASTSTKNPKYRDVMYVEELVGANTVNTVPPQTLDALLDHCEVKVKISDNLGDAHKVLQDLEAAGISVDRVTDELEQEGVKSFGEAFDVCLKSIDQRKIAFQLQLGKVLRETQARITLLSDAHFMERMKEQDPSLWSDDPNSQEEIRKRLGWLYLPDSSRKLIPEIYQFRDEILAAGMDTAVLMGMGGSSLAPELYSLVFGSQNSIKLFIMDSTDPDQVRQISRKVKPEKTIFIVSSKSGGTAEVNAFLEYFWKKTKRICGVHTGSHFVAITDPNTSLERTALSRNFRKIFLADPTVGGRYSALTIFGLLPAGIIGIDLEKLLDKACAMSDECKPSVPAGRNPGLVLGAILGQAALGGKDKLTIQYDEGLKPFGDWLEQLVAESSGKLGRGILPVVGENLLSRKYYEDDRIFVYFRKDGTLDRKFSQIQKAGFPVLVFQIKNTYDLGTEFYRWEIATAVACAIIRVNAFDQPDVQDNKTRTVSKIETFKATGSLGEPASVWKDGDLSAFSSENIHLDEACDLNTIMDRVIGSAHKGDYFAINCYLPYDRSIDKAINQLRLFIQKRSHLPVTKGYGPRFLHSTGQIHKGGANNGVFLQIAGDPIHDEKFGEISFGTLEKAQALGDYESLVTRGRRILRLNVNKKKIKEIVKALVKD
jgi:transaldolase / glucose-6-phosphate isomerase